MAQEFDHLVVAARSLEEGAAWVAARLGVAPGPGGKHAEMGTHNRLMSLGPGRFLEVIAIDPQAAGPAHPRWFELDTPAMQARLAGGAALVHWVERTDDLQAAVGAYPAGLEIRPFSRGAFRWRMALMPDGSFPARGTLPTLIQWDGAHPADSMAESGCRLAGFKHEKGALEARFSTPGGERTIWGAE
ncbi:MAG TPA: VOC family protein [Usitatibacter sp.]|nr:VOC family protein [Usitatibacter sp.]